MTSYYLRVQWVMALIIRGVIEFFKIIKKNKNFFLNFNIVIHANILFIQCFQIGDIMINIIKF